MKAYTYQIGEGSADDMKKVAFSQELLADSLGEAVDKAKAMTRARPVHAGEDTVQLLDKAHADSQMLWSRAADEIRDT